MAERLTGMDVREDAGAEQSIARASTALTAFVGRTLRGPVNRPVLLRSFADYERVFGGLWQPSTLSYAVEQYFESGGSTAVVVRVANGARPCTVTLPAQDQSLVLRALSPSTREFLRAAVDCDGIGENEPLRFNLVVQRVRSIGSEFIEDQEIYRRLSVEPGSSRFVAAALLESSAAEISFANGEAWAAGRSAIALRSRTQICFISSGATPPSFSDVISASFSPPLTSKGRAGVRSLVSSLISITRKLLSFLIVGSGATGWSCPGPSPHGLPR